MQTVTFKTILSLGSLELDDLLLAHRTRFLLGEPLLDALAVEEMATRKSVDHLARFKLVVADGAANLNTVITFQVRPSRHTQSVPVYSFAPRWDPCWHCRSSPRAAAAPNKSCCRGWCLGGVTRAGTSLRGWGCAGTRRSWGSGTLTCSGGWCSCAHGRTPGALLVAGPWQSTFTFSSTAFPFTLWLSAPWHSFPGCSESLQDVHWALFLFPRPVRAWAARTFYWAICMYLKKGWRPASRTPQSYESACLHKTYCTGELNALAVVLFHLHLVGRHRPHHIPLHVLLDVYFPNAKLVWVNEFKPLAFWSLLDFYCGASGKLIPIIFS